MDDESTEGVGVIMAACAPPEEGGGTGTLRADDNEETVRARLELLKRKWLLVEDWYRKKVMWSEFEILGWIPETTPRLMRFCLEEMKKSSA